MIVEAGGWGAREGWREPGQRLEFEEITVVLRGVVRVEHDGGALDVRAGQAVVTRPVNRDAY